MVMSFALVSVLGIDQSGLAALERDWQSHFGSANGVAVGKYGLALFLSSKRRWHKTLVRSLYDARRPSSAFEQRAFERTSPLARLANVVHEVRVGEFMVSLRTASTLAMVSVLAAFIGGCSSFSLNGNTPTAQ